MSLLTRLTTKTAAAVAFAITMIGAAYAADPSGTYAVEGVNPGGESGYTGQVTVGKTGDTYSVTWEVEGTTLLGTGTAIIGEPTRLSVTFGEGQDNGIALLASRPDGTWSGTWTMSGEEVQGSELWTPQ